jgi:hypothetical protein
MSVCAFGCERHKVFWEPWMFAEGEFGGLIKRLEVNCKFYFLAYVFL